MVTGGFSSSGCGGFFPLLSILVYFKTPVAESGHITPSTSRSTVGNVPVGQGDRAAPLAGPKPISNEESQLAFLLRQ